MKKMLLIFLCLSGFCFAESESVRPNLKLAWNAVENRSYSLGIDIVSLLIDDPTIPDSDKIHYINSRSIFYSFLNLAQAYMDDRKLLESMCAIDPSCQYELDHVLEYGFMYHHLFIPPKK